MKDTRNKFTKSESQNKQTTASKKKEVEILGETSKEHLGTITEQGNRSDRAEGRGIRAELRRSRGTKTKIEAHGQRLEGR